MPQRMERNMQKIGFLLAAIICCRRLNVVRFLTLKNTDTAIQMITTAVQSVRESGMLGSLVAHKASGMTTRTRCIIRSAQANWHKSSSRLSAIARCGTLT